MASECPGVVQRAFPVECDIVVVLDTTLGHGELGLLVDRLSGALVVHPRVTDTSVIKIPVDVIDRILVVRALGYPGIIGAQREAGGQRETFRDEVQILLQLDIRVEFVADTLGI